MIAVEYDRGVRLPDLGLWLDPWRPQAFAFISHAHSDHTGRHDETICTPATARLMAARMGENKGTFVCPEFRERVDFGSWQATLLPAGHVLGSAQILVENSEGSLLYTGDFKLRAGLSSERAEAVQADTLIIETTYGRPHYRFPPAEEVIASVIKFCHEAIEDGDTPILFGYALGKAQEILSLLARSGLPIVLHESIAKLARVYQDFGIDFPPYQVREKVIPAGHVLVCPPGAREAKFLHAIKHKRTAVLTGWALDQSAHRRLMVDAAFPLSDHADYDDLCAYVHQVQPRRVLTLHGFAQDFARDLRAEGIEAWALTGANQLELAIAKPSTVSVSQPQRPLEPRDWEQFARICEEIGTTTGRNRKIEILRDYLKSLPQDLLPSVVTWLTGLPFDPLDGRKVEIGPALIRRTLIAASGLPEPEIRAISRRERDSGRTTEAVLSFGTGPRQNVPLAEIKNLFEQLASQRSPSARQDRLSHFLRSLHPKAGAFVIRILTGDLRIGLKLGLVVEALAAAYETPSQAVREAHMLEGNLSRIATLLAEGRLSEASPKLFQPMLCMLASPEPDAASIWERLGTQGAVWIEDKFDGIRAQLHCTPDRVEIYSRDQKIITHSFPEIAKAAARWQRTAILDGEILAWSDGRPLPFFDLQKRLGRVQEDLFQPSDIPVAFLAFDLLHLDDASVLSLPLRQRKDLLASLTLPPPLHIADGRLAHGVHDVESAFQSAREHGNEGLMVKDAESLYQPGRRGHSWIKYKKAFATLDAVVIAAEYGHGRRSQVLSDYTFAVRQGSRFLTIGKAYSGLTDEEIRMLTAEFLASATSRKGTLIEVEPRVVLEIAFDSIQESSRHASGLALRFPRIKRIRRDKTPQDIDTLASARKLLSRHPTKMVEASESGSLL